MNALNNIHLLPTEERFRVLVVDDSEAQRRLLTAVLKRMDVDVLTASSAAQALHLCVANSGNKIGMILCDWQMPGMDGPDFVRALRQIARESYAYVILMTSETDRGRKALGLEAGADDFVTRPLDLSELRARINTGRRILEMQETLQNRNDEIRSTLRELTTLLNGMERDLAEARKIQMAFIPESTHAFHGSDLALRLVTSGQIGGDLVGYFPISETRIGLYSVDVSGHGIASALLTGRIAALFSHSTRRANIAFRSDGVTVMPPDRVMARLNHFMLTEMESDIYFTAVLAYVDVEDGAVEFCQAGHPHPLIRRTDGVVEQVGAGGPPVGLLPDMEFELARARLSPGDSFLTYSDGLTECTDSFGEMLEEHGLMDLLASAPDNPVAAVDAIEGQLRMHSGINEFQDDISMLLFRYGGNAASRRGLAAR